MRVNNLTRTTLGDWKFDPRLRSDGIDYHFVTISFITSVDIRDRLAPSQTEPDSWGILITDPRDKSKVLLTTAWINDYIEFLNSKRTTLHTRAKVLKKPDNRNLPKSELNYLLAQKEVLVFERELIKLMNALATAGVQVIHYFSAPSVLARFLRATRVLYKNLPDVFTGDNDGAVAARTKWDIENNHFKAADTLKHPMTFCVPRSSHDPKLVKLINWPRTHQYSRRQSEMYEARFGAVDLNTQMMEVLTILPTTHDPFRNYLIPLKGNMKFWSLLGSVGNPTYYIRDDLPVYSREGEQVAGRYAQRSKAGEFKNGLFCASSEQRESLNRVYFKLDSNEAEAFKMVDFPTFGHKNVQQQFGNENHNRQVEGCPSMKLRVPIITRASGFIAEKLNISDSRPKVSSIAAQSIVLMDVTAKMAPQKIDDFGFISYLSNETTYIGEAAINPGWFLGLHGTSLFPLITPTEQAWFRLAADEPRIAQAQSTAAARQAVKQIAAHMRPLIRARNQSSNAGFYGREDLNNKFPYMSCDDHNEVGKKAYGRNAYAPKKPTPSNSATSSLFTERRNAPTVFATPRQTAAFDSQSNVRKAVSSSFEPQLDSSRFTIEDSMLEISRLSLDESIDYRDISEFLDFLSARAETWRPKENLKEVLERMVEVNSFDHFQRHFFGYSIVDSLPVPNCFALKHALPLMRYFPVYKVDYVKEMFGKLWDPMHLAFSVDTISATLTALGLASRPHEIHEIHDWDTALEALHYKLSQS